MISTMILSVVSSPLVRSLRHKEAHDTVDTRLGNLSVLLFLLNFLIHPRTFPLLLQKHFAPTYGHTYLVLVEPHHLHISRLFSVESMRPVFEAVFSLSLLNHLCGSATNVEVTVLAHMDTTIFFIVIYLMFLSLRPRLQFGLFDTRAFV